MCCIPYDLVKKNHEGRWAIQVSGVLTVYRDWYSGSKSPFNDQTEPNMELSAYGGFNALTNSGQRS